MNKLQELFDFVYENFLDLFKDFDESFFFGLATGVTLMALPFYKFKGLNYAVGLNGQFHVISVNLLIVIISISYFLLKFEKDNRVRVIGSICFGIMVFSLHDILWLFETHFVPQVFLEPIVYVIGFQEYLTYYFKNLVIILAPVCFFIKYRLLKINKLSILFFVICGAFHLVNIVFQINIYIMNGLALLFMELIDIMPFLTMIRYRPKKDVKKAHKNKVLISLKEG